jgi:abhydrolase domain-containing protein 12
LTYEPIQRSLIYLHLAKWPLPFFAPFDEPEVYGFSPGKVRNLYLETKDGAKIGAWLVLAEEAYDQALREGKLSSEGHFEESVFDAALR